MNCPFCNTVLSRGVGPAPTRCLDCGSLLSTPTETPISAISAQSRHAYATPFGKWFAQVQHKGGWGAAYEFAEDSLPREKLRPLVNNLCESYGHVDSPHLAKFVSFDEDERRVLFKFGRGRESSPLSAAKLPLTPNDVASIVEGLIPGLERLHSAQLAAFDLHPAVIFVDEKLRPVSLLPSLWLASQARHVAHDIEQMPCAAPELARADQYPDAIRADIFAIGALAWLLLIGNARKSNPQALPGSHSAALGSWDAFIDGCCRSNPARRFASLDDVRSALNDVRSRPQPLREDTHQSEVPTHTRHTTTTVAVPSRINRRVALLGAVAVMASAAYVAVPHLSGILPVLGGLGAYRRGFGDTILRYADRSYEGAGWSKLQESDSLSVIAALTGRGRDAIELKGVVGWDDNSFWVIGTIGAASAVIFRFQNGHWSFVTEVETHSSHLTVQRLLNHDTLLLASNDKLYECSSEGVIDHGVAPNFASIKFDQGDICPISHDLYYLFIDDPAYGEICSRISGGVRADLAADKYKEAFVHRSDNTPLKDYRVGAIRHCRSISTGSAFGIHPGPRGGYHDPILVSFRDGFWYKVRDLPKSRSINSAWIACTGDQPESLFVVGQEGYVCKHGIESGDLEQRVTNPQEATSIKLIQIWGTSPEKYWVLSKNGTLWERQGTESRVVIRGLYHDDVEFVSAWVSPTGTVFAVTEKQVYRLT